MRYESLHFLSIQQHAIDLLYGYPCSFFCLKMDKTIASRSMFITNNLQGKNTIFEPTTYSPWTRKILVTKISLKQI